MSLFGDADKTTDKVANDPVTTRQRTIGSKAPEVRGKRGEKQHGKSITSPASTHEELLLSYEPNKLLSDQQGTICRKKKGVSK